MGKLAYLHHIDVSENTNLFNHLIICSVVTLKRDHIDECEGKSPTSYALVGRLWSTVRCNFNAFNVSYKKCHIMIYVGCVLSTRSIQDNVMGVVLHLSLMCKQADQNISQVGLSWVWYPCTPLIFMT